MIKATPNCTIMYHSEEFERNILTNYKFTRVRGEIEYFVKCTAMYSSFQMVPSNLFPVPNTRKIHQINWNCAEASQLRFRYLSIVLAAVAIMIACIIV